MRRYQLTFITKQGIKLPCFKILVYNDKGDLVKTEIDGLGDLVGDMVVARPYIASLAPDAEAQLQHLDKQQIHVEKLLGDEDFM